MNKFNWKQLFICIAIPLAVGAISAFLTQNSMDALQNLNKPLLYPPSWLFPIVWSILFILMGIASYLVLTSGKDNKLINTALIVYGIQLLVNFFWPILFFIFKAYLFSFVWIVLLWILIWSTLLLFYRISKPSAYLLIPYLLWVSFAGYLNLSIYLLN